MSHRGRNVVINQGVRVNFGFDDDRLRHASAELDDVHDAITAAELSIAVG